MNLDDLGLIEPISPVLMTNELEIAPDPSAAIQWKPRGNLSNHWSPKGRQYRKQRRSKLG